MSSINDTVKATGALSVTITAADGTVKDAFDIKNTVVTLGKNWIAQRFVDASIPSQMTKMAVGSGAAGAGEAVVGDTALVTEQGRVDLATAGGVATNNTVLFEAIFPAGTGTAALTEAGVFNYTNPADVGVGTNAMLCRTTFEPINKAADDILTISWTITIN